MQTREKNDGVLRILAVEGDIDLASSSDLREILQAHVKARRPALVLDFSAVSYIDSSGLATLIEYVRNAQKFGGKLALAHLSERVRTVFEIARLDEFLPIFPTLAEASAALLTEPSA